MAADDLADAALERRDVERPAQLEVRGTIVRGAPRIELREEPQPLLRERQRVKIAGCLDDPGLLQPQLEQRALRRGQARHAIGRVARQATAPIARASLRARAAARLLRRTWPRSRRGEARAA